MGSGNSFPIATSTPLPYRVVMTSAKTMSLSDWGLTLALSVIWGSAFFFIVIILRDVPPNTMVFLRVALAVPPLLLWLKFKGETFPLDWANWRNFLLIGALNVTVPYILFAYGQLHISSGLASVLNATTPLWGVLVAHLFTRDERATPGRIAGVLVGFAGVAVMVGGGQPGASGSAALAQIACVLATLFYALASIVGRRMGDSGLSAMQIATGQVAAAALLMIPVVLATETPWNGPMPGPDIWAAALALSVISTSLAYVLYFRLVASAGASNSLLITFLIPVTAILLGVAFLGEQMTGRQLTGMALVALGLGVLDGRVLGWMRRQG